MSPAEFEAAMKRLAEQQGLTPQEIFAFGTGLSAECLNSIGYGAGLLVWLKAAKVPLK